MSGNPFEDALRALYGDEQAARMVDAAKPPERVGPVSDGEPAVTDERTPGVRGVAGGSRRTTGRTAGNTTRRRPGVGGVAEGSGLPNALGRNSADALLAEIGISSAVADHVASCQAVLDERGHDALVVSLRWGVLTVRCGAIAAHQLRIDADQVCAAVNRITDDATVTRLKVQVHA